MAFPQGQDASRFQYEPLQGNEIRLIRICPSSSSGRGTRSGYSPIYCEVHHFPLVEPASSSDQLASLAKLKPSWDTSNRNLGFCIKGHAAQKKSSFAGLKQLPLIRKIRRSTVNGRFPWGDYVALSYTWGDSDETCEIFVNGKPFAVGWNLSCALRMLREKGPIRAGVLIWIDALCIDQGNTDERNLQVPRMREIYQRALNVVVWLGEADEWSDSAMRLIRVLAASWRADEGEALAKFMVEKPLAWHTAVKPAEGSLMCCWDGLRSLMRRPYWKRVWVVQEIAMGGRKSLMLCEEECVDFGQLCDATVSWMGRYATIVSKLMLYDSSMHGVLGRYGRGRTNLTLSRDDPSAVVSAFRQLTTDMRGILDYMQTEIWSFDSDRITFIERLAERVGGASVMCAPPSNLIGLGRASEASRPQDKIYGFLSLMNPEFASQFKVDYRQSAAEVYTTFSIYWTKWSKTLDLFVHCFLEHNHSPSWVPDWNSKASLPLLYLGEEHDNYRAGGKTAVHVEFSTDMKVMATLGVIADAIDGLTAADDEGSDCIVQATTTVEGSFEEIRDVLWRSFTGNRDTNNSIYPPSTPDTDNQRVHSLLDVPLPDEAGKHKPKPYDRDFYKFMATNQAYMINGLRLGQYFANEGRHARVTRDDEEPERTMSFDIRWQILKASLLLQKRRLATTTLGSIGIVPAATQKGDIVAILIGSSVPVVLRPNGDTLKVVGTCYVHGIMEGELFTKEVLEHEICEMKLS